MPLAGWTGKAIFANTGMADRRKIKRYSDNEMRHHSTSPTTLAPANRALGRAWILARIWLTRVSFAGLCLLALAIVTLPGAASAASDRPYLVVERSTGAVLLQNHPFDRWHPASLTKLMTLYVTLKALKAGEISEGSPVTMSKRATREPPSKTGYAVGTRVRVDTAIKILIVKSANDMAVALAEAVGGTVENFVARMNEEAAALGLSDTHFVNPNGLHSPRQYTSARDMAVLARRVLDDFPRSAHWFAISALRDGDKLEHSYNLLLERFAGADGMKTGFVCAGGYNMVASATRGNRHVIAVLFGADSQTDRAVEAASLLLKGFEAAGGDGTVEAMSNPGPIVPPRDLRATMCSEKAIKARYDPAPANARIDSPLLDKPHRGIVEAIAIGGVDAPASDAYLTAGLTPRRGSVPVPEKRPNYVRMDVDGQAIAHPTPVRASVPTPTPSPR